MKTDLDHVARLIDVRTAGQNGEARRLREQARLTKAEVAAAVGVSRACVALWEAGRRKPTGKNAERYAALLELLDRGDP